MISFSTVPGVLGLSSLETIGQSPLGLVKSIENGLPLQALQRVSDLIAPADAQFKYLIVPKATYERRKTQRRLSKMEGALVSRLARVWGFAVEVWGSEEQARAFFFRPHAMLEDQRPIDAVLRSEITTELVIGILGRLKYGSAA